MWLRFSCLLVLIVIASSARNKKIRNQPNIVFVVADDLGWDDVSFHGSNEIFTPNIDMLAYQGIILKQYYTESEGTPSRAALFTGKYPMRLGMQGASIKASEDRGIPGTEKLLPQFLRELGYKTHLVGKWGVGKSRTQYLPTRRGFDDFYGFLGDAVDYLTYNAVEECNGTSFYGLDFFNNLEPVSDQSGHLTDVLTEKAVEVIRNHNTSKPFYLHLSHAAPHVGGALVNIQPPLDFVKANDHIAHSARRLYAALVTSLDASIGNIVAALAERDMLQNTMIIFVTDNGAATTESSKNFGSNFPFRGVKATPWEGNLRSVGIVWQAKIEPKIFDSIFHVTDWLPTVVAAARGTVNRKIDGVNQYNALFNKDRPQRKEVLLTTNDLEGWSAFRDGDLKIIVGDVKDVLSGYSGSEFRRHTLKKKSKPNYDDMLVGCETARVFREILDVVLDVNTALTKRDQCIINVFKKVNSTDALCIPSKAKGCLFNITADPLETSDLWHTSPHVTRRMALRLRSLWTELKPRRQPQSDPRANPSLRNYVWFPWVSNDELVIEPAVVPTFPLQVTMGELQYLVDLNFGVLKDKVNSFIGSMRESIAKSVEGLFSV